MVGWHHQLNGHEFELTLRNSEGQGDLACCSPWGHNELDTTEQLSIHTKEERVSPVAHWVKNWPAMQEMQI